MALTSLNLVEPNAGQRRIDENAERRRAGALAACDACEIVAHDPKVVEMTRE